MKHAQHRIVFGLRSPGSELYTAWCPQTYISISSNKQGLYSGAPCQPSWVSECTICPSTWGGSLESPAPPGPTCPALEPTISPLYLELTQGRGSAASPGETQEICVVFQTNPTETRITTMLSQSVACPNLPGVKQLCSCTLKSLPQVHAMVNTPSARETATANRNVGTLINPPMAKMKFCIILGGKNSVLCSESQGGEWEMNFYKPILRAVTDLSVIVKLSLVSSHIFVFSY